MLTLLNRFHFYEMPSDGGSGDGPGGGGGGPGGGSGGGGGGSLGQGGPGGPGAHGRDSGTRGGGNKGGGGGGAQHGPSPGKLGGKKGTNNTGSGPGGRNPGANRDGGAAAQISAANQAKIDAMGGFQSLHDPQGYFDNTSVTSPAAFDGGGSAPGGFRGALASIGDGFRQASIRMGAEPGIEGYSEDGDYGFGYNSEYGQQLLAGNPNVRAKGALSQAQQQYKAKQFKSKGPPIGTNPSAKADSGGFLSGFGIDTDGFFDNIGQKIAGFVVGKLGMKVGGAAFGPVGALLGGVLGNYFGKKMGTPADADDDGKTGGGFFGGLFDGTGYQASASDLGPGGAGELPPPANSIYINPNASGGQGGNGAGASGDDIMVNDGDGDNPNTTLDKYLEELQADRDEAMAAVRLQERQALALRRISSRRYALGTSYRAA